MSRLFTSAILSLTFVMSAAACSFPARAPTPQSSRVLLPPAWTSTPSSSPSPTPSPLPTRTPTPTPTPRRTWAACADARPSRLQVGDIASIGADPFLPNRLREEPGLHYSVIGQIPPGGVVDILEGPRCADQMVWWCVRTFDGSLTGWTSEGDSNSYWLVPWPVPTPSISPD